MEDNNLEHFGVNLKSSGHEGDLGQKSLNKPTITQVSILYSVVVILFMLLSNLINKLPVGDFYIKGIAAEMFLVLLPPLIFLFLKRFDRKKILRLNKVSFFNIFIIFWIMVFAIPAVGALNLVNILMIKFIFGKTMVSGVPDIINSMDLIKGIVVIGLSAAVCEEILFRGTIQRGFEKLGAVKSIILTAFLFGLMHHDFQKLLGTFLLGAIIGFIVYRTDSVFSGMFAHFTNNSLLVLLSFAAAKLGRITGSSGLSSYDTDKSLSALLNGPRIELAAVFFVWSTIFLVCITAFIALIYALIKNTPNISQGASGGKREYTLKSLVWLVPGVAFIGFLYFAEGLSLKGINIEAVNTVLRVMGF